MFLQPFWSARWLEDLDVRVVADSTYNCIFSLAIHVFLVHNPGSGLQNSTIDRSRFGTFAAKPLRVATEGIAPSCRFLLKVHIPALVFAFASLSDVQSFVSC